jgi:hypothetical protein
MYSKVKKFARYLFRYIILITCFKFNFGDSNVWAQILVAIIIADLASNEE